MPQIGHLVCAVELDGDQASEADGLVSVTMPQRLGSRPGGPVGDLFAQHQPPCRVLPAAHPHLAPLTERSSWSLRSRCPVGRYASKPPTCSLMAGAWRRPTLQRVAGDQAITRTEPPICAVFGPPSSHASGSQIWSICAAVSYGVAGTEACHQAQADGRVRSSLR